MKRIETLTFVIQPPKILLGFKRNKKKFGGKWNGFGGGIEKEDENDLEKCAIREMLDETKTTPINLIRKGLILFKFIDNLSEPDHEVYIFTANNYEGTLKSTEDFLGYAWFNKSYLPDPMMPADKEHIMPLIFNGGGFHKEIHFNKDNKIMYVK